MKATFFERMCSYILDAFIVTVIFSLICMGIDTNETKTEKLMTELDEKLVEKQITPEEYIEEYEILLYDYQKENILSTGISLALTIAYYIVFQYLNKGQTIGKKLMNIKIVDKTNIPVVIVECGFLSNDKERRLLVTEEYQDKLVNAEQLLTSSEVS